MVRKLLRMMLKSRYVPLQCKFLLPFILCACVGEDKKKVCVFRVCVCVCHDVERERTIINEFV